MDRHTNDLSNMFTQTSEIKPTEELSEEALPQSVVPLDQFLTMQSELNQLKEDYEALEELRKQDAAKLLSQTISINNLTEANIIAEERMQQALNEKESI